MTCFLMLPNITLPTLDVLLYVHNASHNEECTSLQSYWWIEIKSITDYYTEQLLHKINKGVEQQALSKDFQQVLGR